MMKKISPKQGISLRRFRKESLTMERKNCPTFRWKYFDVNADKFHFGGAGAATADTRETTH